MRIGDLGETSTPLTPGGFVRIDGYRVHARCESGYLDAKQTVVVIDGDNLGLIVRGCDSSVKPTNIPRQGEVVFASFGEKVKSDGDAHVRLQMQQVRVAARQSVRLGSVAGFLVGVLMTAWCRPFHDPDLPKNLLLANAITIFSCAIWGAIVGRVMYGLFERMGHSRLGGFVAGAIVFTIATAGAVFGLVQRHHGQVVSLFSTLSVTVVLASGILAMGLLGEWLGGQEDPTP
jgi:hypothetical protein